MSPVTVHAPRLGSRLDPLLAEARRRATRRVIATLLVVAVAGVVGLTLALRSNGPGTPPHGVTTAPSAAWRWVSAPEALLRQCRATAAQVGYRVPCPRQIPVGLARGVGAIEGTGCATDRVAAAGFGACPRYWRGWVLGVGAVNADSIAFTASPGVVPSPVGLVNGPPPYAPTSHVRALGTLRIHGWLAHVVFVPQKANEGSQFAYHVALIWTTGGHTYGIGVSTPQLARGSRRTAGALRDVKALIRRVTLVGR
jgi:hypothetical protein